MEFTINDSIVVAALKAKKKWALEAGMNGMERGMRLYSAHIQKTQMSGRPGLNVQTGNLRRSWHVKRLPSMGVRLATSAIYARIHQYGGVIRARSKPFLVFHIPGVGWRRKKEVRIPKRLNVVEELHTVGRKFIVQQMTLAIRQALQRR